MVNPPRTKRTGSVFPIVLNVLLGIASVVLLIAAALGWLAYSGTKMANKKLVEDQNALVDKYNRLVQDRNNLVTQLNQTQQELVQTQQKLTDKSRVPFSVTYRNALTGPGYVLVMTNRSDKALTVIATFENPTLNKKKSISILLRSGQAQEIGYAEGWAFSSGDQITLTNADYAPLSVHIP
jgi:uncharacterized protein YlxW (UPF0749 family)